MKLFLSLAILLCAGLAHSLPTRSVDSLVDRDNYEGFQAISVTLTTDQRVLLKKLSSHIPIDTWKEPQLVGPRGSKMAPLYRSDFMVDKVDIPAVTHFLESHNIKYKILINNVQSLVTREKEAGLRHRAERAAAGVKAIDWKAYYRVDEHYDWLKEVVAANSDIATVENAGTSTEGRQILVVKISQAGSPANKRSVFIDGAFHAREWISPAIVTWMINDLLTNRAANKDVLDAFDFYIIPFINPDGYEYSHESSRMWRKTRSDHNSAAGCYGVDPNRNSDFHFGGGGTSNDKCSDIYRGPSAFSEPETAALRDVINGNLGNWHAYFTIHSYGLMWLTPWSWTYDHPPDTDDLVAFGLAGADAISAIHGTNYDVGESSEVYGITAGSSDDWAHGVADVKYSQTIEVDNGSNGFQTPASKIISIAEETWEGIKASCLSAK
jgi:carboxypeptidase A2